MRDDALFRRRAWFVGAALLVSACSKDEGRATISPTPSTEKPAASAPASIAKVAPPPERPAKTTVVSAAREKEKDAVLAKIETVHAALDALAGSIPTACATSDPKCVAAWQAYFRGLERARGANHLGAPRPLEDPDEIALDDLRRTHAAWHGRWLRDIDAAVAAVHAKAEAGDREALSGLWVEAKAVHAKPCMLPICD